MAFQALLEADLISLARSWAVRIWCGLMVVQALLIVPASINDETAADALAGLLSSFPVIWSTFVIINSSGAVSSEAGVVADSILSKAVSRYNYILAKMTARLLTVLSLYGLVVVPAAYLIARYGQGELERGGVVWGIMLIGMTLVLLTTLSVALSALFNRTLVALIVAWFLWYISGAIFALFQLEYLSPLHIVENLPDLFLGQYTGVAQWRIMAGFGIASCVVVCMAVWHFARKDL